jgi:hypothetical protein
VGIDLGDPRSQKRDLGHPSISPFDIAEGTSFVISLPTRFSESAARDDKGKGAFVLETHHFSSAATNLEQATGLPFVIPSEAEGSAVSLSRG